MCNLIFTSTICSSTSKRIFTSTKNVLESVKCTQECTCMLQRPAKSSSERLEYEWTEKKQSKYQWNEMHTFWKHLNAYIWCKTPFYLKITCKCTTNSLLALCDKHKPNKIKHLWIFQGSKQCEEQTITEVISVRLWEEKKKTSITVILFYTFLFFPLLLYLLSLIMRWECCSCDKRWLFWGVTYRNGTGVKSTGAYSQTYPTSFLRKMDFNITWS